MIAALDRDDVHHNRAAAILSDHERFQIHPITLAETLVHPVRVGKGTETLDAVRFAGIGLLTSHDDDPLTLAQIRVRTGLKMPDCCVLLAAIRSTLTVATFDDALASAARQLGFDVVS
jgi:predicted nucleic acid-binding protein